MRQMPTRARPTSQRQSSTFASIVKVHATRRFDSLRATLCARGPTCIVRRARTRVASLAPTQLLPRSTGHITSFRSTILRTTSSSPSSRQDDAANTGSPASVRPTGPCTGTTTCSPSCRCDNVRGGRCHVQPEFEPDSKYQRERVSSKWVCQMQRDPLLRCMLALRPRETCSSSGPLLISAKGHGLPAQERL